MTARALAEVLQRAEAQRGAKQDKTINRARWDWYAASCPCGVPPGECRAHPWAGTQGFASPSDRFRCRIRKNGKTLNVLPANNRKTFLDAPT